MDNKDIESMLEQQKNEIKEAKEIKEAQSKVYNQNDYLINRLISQQKTPDEYFLEITLKDYSAVLVPPEIRNDEFFALSVVEFKPDAYKHFSDEIKQNLNIALLAMKDGSMYEHAPAQIKANKELALEAIKTFPMAAKFIPDTLKADKDVALATVAMNGFTLKVFTPELREDKDVVLAAVSSNPNAYVFASNTLKQDTDVLMKAADFLYSPLAAKFNNEDWYQSSKQALSEHISLLARESLSTLCDWVREQPQRIANLDENLRTNKHLANAAKNFIKHCAKQSGAEPWVLEAHKKVLETEHFTRTTSSLQFQNTTTLEQSLKKNATVRR